MNYKEAYELYKEDLEKLPKYSDKEIKSMAARFKDGEESLREELINANLYLVSEISKDYICREAKYLEIVHEGNMALVNSLDTYIGGDFFDHIEKFIRISIETYIEDIRNGKKEQKELVAKVNKLDQVSKQIAKKGKTPTLEELSKAMELPEEEVQSLIDEMMKAMQVLDDEDENAGEN